VRYFKGYVSISDERDVPVLLHIRNARAISFRQLCELLLLEGVEKLGRVIIRAEESNPRSIVAAYLEPCALNSAENRI
jgi:hypothetical protein